jgi:hypothetical protein
VNTALLIDAIVRQTTVLIAALATAAGQRTTLAHVADQVFGDLVRELNDQGVGHKVIADMFGMALRTYHARVARLSASGTEQGRSLWESVLAYIEKSGPVPRAAVLSRFGGDPEASVRGVLRDLVESGLLYQSGRADALTYRAADAADAQRRQGEPEMVDRLLHVAIYRNGPVGRAGLSALVPIDDEAALDASLARLLAEGTISQVVTDGLPTYRCDTCVIRFGDPMGWEAAVFDHHQAMVAALVAKLRGGQRIADMADRIGGSTFVFDVWSGHPMADEAMTYLRRLREQGIELRRRIADYNHKNTAPESAAPVRVVAYVGQMVQEESSDGEG